MVAPGAHLTITARDLQANNISIVQRTTQYFSVVNEGVNALPAELAALVKQAVQDAIGRPTSTAEPLSSVTKHLAGETEANSAEAFIAATQDVESGFGLYPLSSAKGDTVSLFTPAGDEHSPPSLPSGDVSTRLREELSIHVTEWETTVQRLMDTLDRPKMRKTSIELQDWLTENEKHLEPQETARCYVLLARLEIVFEMDEKTGD